MLSFTNSAGNLFNRLGAVFHAIQVNQTFQATTLPAVQADVAAQFTTRQDLIPTFQSSITTAQNANQSFTSRMNAVAANVLIIMVQEDNPQPAATLNYALPELIRQMGTSNTVTHCVVGSNQTTGTNTGTGSLIISTTNEAGANLENMLAETLTLTCAADSLPGQGTAPGSERFTARGDLPAGVLDYGWPGGSGGATGITAANADVSGTSTNVLTNSNFETWAGTSNGFTGWTAATGTYATTIGTLTGYRGSLGLAITGTGTQTTQLTQAIRTATIPGIVTPLTKYALAFHTKVSASPSAGVLRVALKDTINGTVLGGVTVTLSGETTSWALHSGTFNTPLALPPTLIAVVELTTALDNAKVLTIDDIVITEMVQHRNGPFFSIIPGSVNFVRGDSFSVGITNDRGGKFQEWFCRCFAMDAKGLLLPSAASASATISDTLIA